jgi:hypothetical protein
VSEKDQEDQEIKASLPTSQQPTVHKQRIFHFIIPFHKERLHEEHESMQVACAQDPTRTPSSWRRKSTTGPNVEVRVLQTHHVAPDQSR